jgi:DNA-binding transcriptional regulator YiaG
MQPWTPQKIKKLRKKYKLSQRAFGDLLGVTRMHIYYIERGEKRTSKTLQLLLDCVEEKLKKGE